jgi:chemotaxis protein methyltransferase CheR
MMQRRSLPTPFMDEAAALVRRRTGFVIGAPRRDAFETALVEAMCSAGVHDPVVYLAGLAGTPALMDELAGRCTIGETYFLREPDQLDLIEREILPERLRAAAPRRLRLWSAGCATGEEPHTLAILASRLGALGRVEVVGTDISRSALAVARAGRYRRWSFRGVAPGVVERHFRQNGESYDLDPALRRAVEFRYLNLAAGLETWAAAGISGMDLILCRNVLIYFDRETVTRVAAGLIASLAEDGWLLLGASDPLIGDLVPCTAVVTRAGLGYRRPGAPAGRIGAAAPAFAWPQIADPVVATPYDRSDVAAYSAASPADAEGAGIAQPASGADERTGEPVHDSPAPDAGGEAAAVTAVRTLADRGELAEAERSCTAALERHGMSAELHLLHTQLLNAARRYDAGAVAARKALFLDRGLAMAHLAHGAALAGLRDVPGARGAFTIAARLLAGLSPDDLVPASGGETAGRLADLVRAELELLVRAAA